MDGTREMVIKFRGRKYFSTEERGKRERERERRGIVKGRERDIVKGSLRIK